MVKTATIDQFLTVAQINEAIDIWKEHRNERQTFHELILEKVVRPNMAQINKRLGQENDPDYIAYMLEFAFIAVERD